MRRRLFEALADGPLPVHGLMRGLPVTRSAVSQHLQVLRRVGLVTASKRGREMVYARVEAGLEPASEWVARFRSFQAQRGVVGVHVASVTVPVIDQDAAAAFYTTACGFTIVNDRRGGDGFRWVSVAPPGGSCVLGLIAAPRTGVWTGITFLTDDIESIYQTWRSRGVGFEAPPAPTWGAISAIFTDLDGNRHQLAQLPHPTTNAASTTDAASPH
jgi:DNA-binding transcriptional ArsR family regulator